MVTVGTIQLREASLREVDATTKQNRLIAPFTLHSSCVDLAFISAKLCMRNHHDIHATTTGALLLNLVFSHFSTTRLTSASGQTDPKR